MLGPAREERVSFHEEEIRWLVEVHREFERGVGVAGRVVDRGTGRVVDRGEGTVVDWGSMDWERIAREFNQRFEGRRLGDGNG